MTIHKRNGLTIHTSFVHPPIPDRTMDWDAVEDSYEPGMPVGWGRTEEIAIQDLLAQIDEANDEELRHAVETGEIYAP